MSTRRTVTALALAAITLVGLGLRLVGIDFGRPYVYHPDEFLIAKPAMSMVASGGWDPHIYLYPSALMYAEKVVVVGVHALTGATLDDAISVGYADYEALPEQFPYFLAGRVLVAILGSLTVLVVFAAGRMIAGPIAGLVAALVISVAPLTVVQSHYLTTDIPAALLVAVSIAIAIRWPDSSRGLVLAGLAAGLAASTKYNAILVLIVPITLALSARWPARRRLGDRGRRDGCGGIWACRAVAGARTEHRRRGQPITRYGGGLYRGAP